MKESTQEQSLKKVNEKSLVYKIKCFFKNLFHKNKAVKNPITDENNINDTTENSKNSFIESIKNIENEETQLLQLQKQYRRGEIKEEDLTGKQLNALCALYDSQIENLRKSNEQRMKRLLEYRKITNE